MVTNLHTLHLAIRHLSSCKSIILKAGPWKFQKPLQWKIYESKRIKSKKQPKLVLNSKTGYHGPVAKRIKIQNVQLPNVVNANFLPIRRRYLTHIWKGFTETLIMKINLRQVKVNVTNVDMWPTTRIYSTHTFERFTNIISTIIIFNQ